MISRRQKLQQTVLDFYQNPVAQVSTELFLTIGAVIFFAMFAIRPTLVTMSDLVRELEEKRKLDDKLSQKIAALSSVQAQYNNLSQRAVVLDQAFPTTPEVEKTLKIIEKIASDNKLAITSLQLTEFPKEAEDKDPAKLYRLMYPISVTVTGDYGAIKNFVTQLKSSRRILTVETITFSTKEDREQKELNATITIQAHYFGEKE